MKVNGNIFIDKEGIVFSNVRDDARTSIRDFSDMLEEAVVCKDKYFYKYSKEWEEFFLKTQDFKDLYWHGAGQIANQLLFNYGKFLFQPQSINSIDGFNKLSLPRTHGGFRYSGCPETDYVHDKESINDWHDKWFRDNQDKIDWKDSNGIMPRKDRVAMILREELYKLQAEVKNKSVINYPPTDVKYLESTDYTNQNYDIIVSDFYKYIMSHKPKDSQLISYSTDIGSKICDANYYHRETELERLEKDHGNNHISTIYSIKKDEKYQFLSIDTQHGMFELCDDNGDHIGELRFDGSPNGENTEEADHSLQCVEEWKHIYSR